MFVGLISLIAGLLVLVFPGLGVLFVVYLLAFAFMMLGIERLAMGIEKATLKSKSLVMLETADVHITRERYYWSNMVGLQVIS